MARANGCELGFTYVYVRHYLAIEMTRLLRIHHVNPKLTFKVQSVLYRAGADVCLDDEARGHHVLNPIFNVDLGLRYGETCILLHQTLCEGHGSGVRGRFEKD
jgi:hypothetical protein